MFVLTPRLALRLPKNLRTASTSLPKPPPTPTTFSGKSSPQNIHERPEQARGIPPVAKIRTAAGPTLPRQTSDGPSENFKGPSKPRLVYERPAERELPKLTIDLVAIALATLGLGAWGLFLLHATNSERTASSVMRQVTFQLRNSSEVAAVLGENVRLADNWWGFGEPWVSGTINLMQGRVDLKFRIKGSKDSGTVYFTSIRPHTEGAWRIVRYKVIADSGDVVRLEEVIR
ncbi:cytochrome c oxidase assembly factor 1, partial [Tremellales sp. Uapishka_1]